MTEQLKYLEAILFQAEIKTEGHSPLLVITNDYSPYYIKNTRGQNPATPIINEFICHYLLKIWNLNTPEISAVKVEKEILPETLSMFHKLYYYENITFGSKKMDQVIEMNEFINIEDKYDFNKFKNPDDLIKICLFDIWVENDDRKPTNPNVLFNTGGDKIEIVALDNAFTFSTMNYDSLYIEGVTQPFNDNLLETDFAKKIIEYKKKESGWIEYIEEYFYLCVENCNKNFDEIAKNIPSTLGFTKDLKDALHAFLFNPKRNKLVLTDFYSRL